MLIRLDFTKYHIIEGNQRTVEKGKGLMSDWESRCETDK